MSRPGNMQGREYRRPVYYYDTDAAGVVYHGNYFHFCEEARSEIFEAVMGMGLKEYAARTGINFVISRTSAEYKRPVPMGAGVVLKTFIDDLAAVRTKYRHEFFVDGVLCAVVKIEVVAINVLTFRPSKLPPDIIDGYKRAFGII